MINTNKRIHIYNRYRTIYTSKNNYYIRHNKKYIDLYTILKKISAKDGIKRGGGAKDNLDFLNEELSNIKNSIVIFKLLMDDKQSEAINLYINLIDMINSKKDLIIKKIDTYTNDDFSNELNKSSIITYVKKILYKNFFINYLINIITKIDINSLIIKEDSNAIENIIKLLFHYISDDKEDIRPEIDKYNEIIQSDIKTNCTNNSTLKDIIKNSIEKAIEKVESAQNEEDSPENEENENEKEIQTDKNKKRDYKDGIKKAIDEDMAVIKEDLENLENKDYVDRLLDVLKQEILYYKQFTTYHKVTDYLTKIEVFHDKYITLYDGYKSKLEEKKTDIDSEISNKKEDYNNNNRQILKTKVSTNIETRKGKAGEEGGKVEEGGGCLLYTSPSPRDRTRSRMPSSA